MNGLTYEIHHDWILYIAAFASAFAITLVTTPLAKKIAFKVGAVQHPRARDMHTQPMPRMGGIAIVIGFLATMGMMALLMPGFRTWEYTGFIVGAVIVAALGIVDDKLDLHPLLKLAVQIVVAVVVVLSGIRIEIVAWPFPAYLENFAVPLTIIWIVAMTNAVNLIDGLDGLAAGVSAIGALCLMALCILSGSPLAVVLSATLAGSALGFLPRNFNPAEIFMGDTGTLFLGYVLAVSSILGVFKGYTLVAVLVVCFALSLPIFDTVFAFFRRIYRQRSVSAWMHGDRGHLHHRLIDKGYSHKQTVIILYGVSMLSAIIAVVVAAQNIHAMVITGLFLLVLLLMLFVYRHRIKHKGNTCEACEARENDSEVPHEG